MIIQMMFGPLADDGVQPVGENGEGEILEDALLPGIAETLLHFVAAVNQLLHRL